MVTQDYIVYFKNAGRMKKNLLPVFSHPLDIPEKVRAIDKDCFIMYNPDTDKYEIHNKRYGDEGGLTLMLNLPYMELDNRAAIVLKNSLETTPMEAKKEIEEHNARLEAEQEKKAEDEALCKIREAHQYCLRHVDKEKLDDDAYKTRFV